MHRDHRPPLTDGLWLLTASVLLFVLLTFLIPAPASSHRLPRPKHMTVGERHAFQLRVLHHDRSVARFFRRHARLARTSEGRHSRAWHRRQKTWTTRELAETFSVLVRLLDPRMLGRQMAAERGWVGEQWRCLEHLWGPLEGSWNVHADNPNSDAYGIPQALPGWKMGTGWQHSALVQIRWGLGYIAGRYGTPCSARGFRLANGWY